MTRAKTIVSITILLITLVWSSKFVSRAYNQIKEPIIFDQLRPPSLTPYGGLLLKKGYQQSTDYTCGPASLALAFKSLGVNVTEKEIAEKIPVSPLGTSMLALADEAKMRGFKATGLKLTKKDLLRIKKPVIAFINGNHFVVIVSNSRQELLLIDPSLGKVLIKKKDFFKIWDGYVMALERGE
ncbi:MAG: C39 family peptidase [bacterium]